MKDWNYDNEQWTELPTYLRHLPLFTRHYDLTSFILSSLWALCLKAIFTFYIRLKTSGSLKETFKKNKKLILICNHTSHLDAVAISAAIPFRFWRNLYITAAKDYWFRNHLFTWFSKHCLGAIPVDRKKNKMEALKLCVNLLKDLDSIWLIVFPEGTRSRNGNIKNFKKGVSLFARQSETPLLFLYLDGTIPLWPKGRLVPKPGRLHLHLGPIVPPGPIEEIQEKYTKWSQSITKL